MQANRIFISLRSAFVAYGAVFSIAMTLFALANNFNEVENVGLAYATGYFMFSCLLGLSVRKFGLSIFIFLLPLTPTLNSQVSAALNLTLGVRTLSGLDLVAGFIVGVMLNYIFFNRNKCSTLLPPWLIGLLCFTITSSVILAITRNLWQAASLPSVNGVLYNFFHFRVNQPHDDFYPLTDLVVFGLAAALVSTLIPILRENPNANRAVFQPIMLGIVFSAAWSLVQARTGVGLPWSSASGYRFYNSTGFAGTGFQPDIHAFAGHMLVGAVGLWGCLKGKAFPLRPVLFASALTMGWIGLIVSKSRGSIMLAIASYALAVGYFLWRRSKVYFFATLSVLLAFAGGTYLFHRIGLSIIPLWLIQYIEALPRIHVNNLLILNEHFGYRAEIYHAALRMFNALPFFGLGQGAFYRMSADYSFAHSRFLSSIHGENAHNYFLQILAELGIVGSLVLLMVILVPVVMHRERKVLVPTLVAIFSIFLGNVFAHSLLIRENFFLMAVFVALLYTSVQSTSSHNTTALSKNAYPIFTKWLLGGVLIMSSLMLLFTGIEIERSFDAPPYLYGSECFKSSSVQPSEWTTGRLEIETPPGANGLLINLLDAQPDVAHRPLIFEIDTIDATQAKIAHEQRSIDTNGAQAIEIILPKSTRVSDERLSIVITLSRCFTPRNLGINSDNRRLGLLVHDVRFF